MLNFIGAGIGVFIGAFLAWRRRGNWADMAQWAVVFALLFFVLGTIAMLVFPAPLPASGG